MNDDGGRFLVVLLVLLVLVGLVLLSNPNCRRGCRTVAQHLVSHGIQGLLGLG